MSRFDMKEFGEAAPFLRKSELELLATHTVPFDGRPDEANLKMKNDGDLNAFKLNLVTLRRLIHCQICKINGTKI